MELAAEGEEALALVKPQKPGALKGGLQKALSILRQLYSCHLKNPQTDGPSCATPSISFDDWRTACMAAKLYKRTDNFKAAAKKLLLRKLIRYDETKTYVYMTEMMYENEN
jgi:hypothetical protein